MLHPGYLEKSKFNIVSVDQNGEDYWELKESIEFNGVKDPILTRINPDGSYAILSGQCRHMIARELNYPLSAIIQKINDADAKILISDGNLHRSKISTYDRSRTLRVKMDGVKQKAGRRKKGLTAEELDSDEKLAKEMGISVSKFNRIIRLSEASQEVCNRVDDGTLPLSAASALFFLKPENQDLALHLTNLGYKFPTEQIEYLKNVSNDEYVIGHGGGAHMQHTCCTAISWEEAQPGDLLIVHCASGANNVVITGLEGFISIGRPLYYGE